MSPVQGVAALVAPHLERSVVLAPFHPAPQVVGDDAQVRDFAALPLVRRIGPGYALASTRILYVGAAVPHQLSDVELVVENAGAALLLAADGRVAPGAPLGAGDAFLVEAVGDGPGADAVGEHLENPHDNGRFGRVDRAQAGFLRVRGHIVAKRLAGQDHALLVPFDDVVRQEVDAASDGVEADATGKHLAVLHLVRLPSPKAH